MLTEEQYKILRDLRDGVPIDEDAIFETLMELKNIGYVRYTNYKRYNSLYQRACDFKITEKGKVACEEYEKSLRQEDREIKSLQIAKRANRISIAAIIISSILSACAVIASVLISLYLNP